MKVPTIRGVIRRRLLLNYRVDPDVCAALLPGSFRPKLIRGRAIAGICLIRLERIRPKGLPAILGITSENTAHRFAVEWDGEDGSAQSGVFIPRRDTSSQLNALAGGRLFPGVHHRSHFTVEDAAEEIAITVRAKAFDQPLVEIRAHEVAHFPTTSVFESLEESSQFFESGCVGYSSDPGSHHLDGLRLAVDHWEVTALEIESIASAYFDDPAIFPAGSTTFDHALLMRDIPHEWHALPAKSNPEGEAPAEP